MGKADVVEVSAAETCDVEAPRTEVIVQTATAGIVRALQAFDGEARTVFDPGTGRLLSAQATIRSRKRKTSASIALDREGARTFYFDHRDAARNVTIPNTPSAPALRG